MRNGRHDPPSSPACSLTWPPIPHAPPQLGAWQEYEKKFRRWGPSSLIRMLDGTALPTKKQLASAQERGITLDVSSGRLGNTVLCCAVP